MARVIYALCAVTSLACAILLLRSYARTRARLLLWSGLCFAFLFINNVMLYVDVELLPSIDLSIARTIPVVAALAVLLYGLIWELKR